MLRIATIGAGASGLACAYRLLTSSSISKMQIVVFEASNKFGGRMQTANVGDTPVDLGAAFVHGIEGHSVVNYLDAFNLKLNPLTQWQYGRSAYDPQTGLEVDPTIASAVSHSQFALVKKIDYSDKSGKIILTVENNNNTTSEKHEQSNFEKIEFDHVVVSVSLGVLKQPNLLEFSPSLPPLKQKAINDLGFGRSNKIFLEFKERFWTTQKARFIIVGDSDIGVWIDMWKQPLVCGFATFDLSSKIEKMSDSQVVEFALESLGKVFGKEKVKNNFTGNFQITRWQSEPYILGAYSYVGINATSADFANLKKPFGVNENLAIIGEATDARYFGSAQSSLLSGEEEADRILKRISKSNWFSNLF